jgi:hypothetical protein
MWNPYWSNVTKHDGEFETEGHGKLNVLSVLAFFLALPGVLLFLAVVFEPPPPPNLSPEEYSQYDIPWGLFIMVAPFGLASCIVGMISLFQDGKGKILALLSIIAALPVALFFPLFVILFPFFLLMLLGQ